MQTKDRLASVLSKGYFAHGIRAAHAEFIQHVKDDPDFLKTAQAEYNRLDNLNRTLGCQLSQRCYASAQHLKFLKSALENHAAQIWQ